MRGARTPRWPTCWGSPRRPRIRSSYRDDNHEPELVCALTPFDALCGLRPVADIVGLLAELSGPELGGPAEVLARSGSPGGFRALLTTVLTAPEPAAVVIGCRTHADGGSRFAPAYREALGLAERFPGDPGVVVSLLLNRVHLRPGEAMYVPPWRLHTYLSGLAVEVMACSDNVLRGGLTPKHVGVAELLSVAELVSAAADTVTPAGGPGGWAGYAVPVPDFALGAGRTGRCAGAQPPRRPADPAVHRRGAPAGRREDDPAAGQRGVRVRPRWTGRRDRRRRRRLPRHDHATLTRSCQSLT